MKIIYSSATAGRKNGRASGAAFRLGEKVDTSAEERFHGKLEKGVIHIRSVKLLKRPMPGERIAVGDKDDYKPCIAKLPKGELLMTAYNTITRRGRLW